MIKYVKGDLFKLLPNDKYIVICHIVNDIRAWGSGFVIPLAEHFPRAKEMYLQHFNVMVKLGNTQMVRTDQYFETGQDIMVANMCAQTGIMSHSTGDRSKVNPKPIRYEHLISCMKEVRDYTEAYLDIEIHAPAFGCDRAGGNWGIIHELIEEIWKDIPVTIYYLNDGQRKIMEKNLDLKISDFS